MDDLMDELRDELRDELTSSVRTARSSALNRLPGAAPAVTVALPGIVRPFMYAASTCGCT
jgi:hypothetical protein